MFFGAYLRLKNKIPLFFLPKAINYLIALCIIAINGVKWILKAMGIND
jgi:hypothetical protein